MAGVTAGETASVSARPLLTSPRSVINMTCSSNGDHNTCVVSVNTVERHMCISCVGCAVDTWIFQYIITEIQMVSKCLRYVYFDRVHI